MTTNESAARYQAQAREACLARLATLREAVKGSDVRDWSGDFWHVAALLEDAVAFLENRDPRAVRQDAGGTDRLARRLRLGSGMPLSR